MADFGADTYGGGYEGVSGIGGAGNITGSEGQATLGSETEPGAGADTLGVDFGSSDNSPTGAVQGLLATLAAMFAGKIAPPNAPLGGVGVGGGEDQRGGGGEPFRAPTAVQQALQQALQGGRGAIGTMPEFLRPELVGLSPFQQRAAIGTYGTSSESGRYRAPETIDYYKTLVENTLKNEMGVPIGSPLPIEWQYLREVLGVSPPETTDAFLGALANYQTPI